MRAKEEREMGAFDGSGVLKGKVALVTGGGRGIGKGMTAAMAKAGASVAFTDIRDDLIAETESELRGLGLDVIGIHADGCSDEEVKHAVQKTVDTFGSLWMVINNANMYQDFALIEDTSREKLETMFEAGFYASWRYMMAAFPHMKAGGGGRLVNFGSDAGLWGLPGNLPYAANKEALRAMMRVAAREWGKYQITANTIIPGAATTGMLKYFEDNPEHGEKRRRELLFGRFGIPEDDLGALAVFLCSDGSAFITGETMKMNGGVNINAL
jgi:NAD(P)-dependent dehydrogenase (short-subunit alcohol dehydrogenase family)